MVTYVIGFSSRDTNDLSWIDVYMKKAPSLLSSHKGKVLAIGKPINLERGKNWQRFTLIEFPSYSYAYQFLEDQDYQDIKNIRIMNTVGEMYCLNKND